MNSSKYKTFFLDGYPRSAEKWRFVKIVLKSKCRSERVKIIAKKCTKIYWNILNCKDPEAITKGTDDGH